MKKRRTNKAVRRIPNPDGEPRAIPKILTLASLGYFSTPVQRVVKRHASALGAVWAERFALAAAASVHPCRNEIRIERVPPRQRGAVIELLTAFYQAWNDLERPTAWILQEASTGFDGEPDGKHRLLTYERLAMLIRGKGGPMFSKQSLAQTVSRLRLLRDDSNP